MAPMPPAPQDEHPHAPDGDPEGWSEAWTFDFASADGDLGGWVRYVRFTDRAWYHAALAGPRRQLLAVLDHDVPFRSSPLEVRTTGLWADHTCETPLDHWTVGLETFALGVDDPLELHGRQHGDRVALGFDLEWEATGPTLDTATGYEQPCQVHGEVLVGAATIDLDAVGARHHDWGRLDWWADTGWQLTGTAEGQRWWTVDHRAGLTCVRLIDAAGHVREELADGQVDVDAHGLPTGARIRTDDTELAVEVLAVTPVPLERAGQRSRRPRALCRLREPDGGIGIGWLEVRGASAGVLEG